MPKILQSNEYKAWFARLRDRQAQQRIQARVFRLADGNPGQHRVLTGGVAEMKVDVGPGYRVYYTMRGAEVILLLAGGDKRTQQADISLAIELAKEASK